MGKYFSNEKKITEEICSFIMIQINDEVLRGLGAEEDRQNNIKRNNPNDSRVGICLWSFEPEPANMMDQLKMHRASCNQGLRSDQPNNPTLFNTSNMYPINATFTDWEIFLKLPPCDTQEFYGGYEEWPSFRDMFTAIYGNHPRLTQAQTLYHLRNKTKREAGSIVGKYPLSDQNYLLAWDALRARYKIILVDNQLKILFNIPAQSLSSPTRLPSWAEMEEFLINIHQKKERKKEYLLSEVKTQLINYVSSQQNKARYENPNKEAQSKSDDMLCKLCNKTRTIRNCLIVCLQLTQIQIVKAFLHVSSVRTSAYNMFHADRSQQPEDTINRQPPCSSIVANSSKGDPLFLVSSQKTCYSAMEYNTIRQSTCSKFHLWMEENDKISSTLRLFWETEEIPKSKVLSETDLYCKELYKKTTYRRSDDLQQIYNDVLEEYIILGHMKKTNSSEIYQKALLQKLVNGSRKTKSSFSFNDVLHIGPTFIYRQILVTEADCPFQRNFYRTKNSSNIEDYELLTVTFGVNCAPYLAIRTLLQLATDLERQSPLSSHILRHEIYVDDILAGEHTLALSLEAQSQLIKTLKSAGFPLRKITANNRKLLENIPTEDILSADFLKLYDSSSTIGNDKWNHVLTHENPADLGTRGYNWPKSNPPAIALMEQRKVEVHCSVTDELNIIQRFSSYRPSPLTQKFHYSEDLKNISVSKPISKKSTLLTLNPFLDAQGLMRVNGRLANAPLTYDERFPLIIPNSSQFCKIFLEFVHKTLVHADITLMMSAVRSQFYIPGLKRTVKKCVHHCLTCVCYKQQVKSQIMAALPKERSTLSLPFAHTGVDFASVFQIKSGNLRNSSYMKGYASRRGLLKSVMSDNGTNFIGASKSLLKEYSLFLQQSSKDITDKYSIKELEWKILYSAGANRKCSNFTTNITDVIFSAVHYWYSPDNLSLLNRWERLKALHHKFGQRWKNEYFLELHKRTYKYCSNYFSRTHLIGSCISMGSSQICCDLHHTLLHPRTAAQGPRQMQPQQPHQRARRSLHNPPQERAQQPTGYSTATTTPTTTNTATSSEAATTSPTANSPTPITSTTSYSRSSAWSIKFLVNQIVSALSQLTGSTIAPAQGGRHVEVRSGREVLRGLGAEEDRPNNIKKTTRTIPGEQVTCSIRCAKIFDRLVGRRSYIPDELINKWQVVKNISCLQEIRVLRWVQLTTTLRLQMYGFVDASEKAYAAFLASTKFVYVEFDRCTSSFKLEALQGDRLLIDVSIKVIF
ncbi:hypothetical protein CVS40_11972 [Lucilia cuprina]|nr:hypothetical protein CVS40_11972 [Lucilia cuprina]